MPPKRGVKRKANRNSTTGDVTQDEEPLSLPKRETWSGWVEMESEPAFFNVMLKEMGVQDVKIQEVYGLDDDMLAILPQPVHALIFLFRYRTEDRSDEESTSSHDHIWFANQIPEFACATVALLNIVNNIPDLRMGPELRQFRDLTADLDPVSRGDAIDSFDFVRRIHNSFARENDLLTADMHTKIRFDKAKRKDAAAKGRATKEAKKLTQTPLKENAKKPAGTPLRSSTRPTRTAAKPQSPSPALDAAPTQPSNVRISLDNPSDDDDDEFKAFKKPQSAKEETPSLRRSGRARKPRQDPQAVNAAELGYDEDDGFHFIAYMPIDDHVWKLDGLDKLPQDLGAFQPAGEVAGGTANWIHLAQPAIVGRMAQFEGADIQFNLMAVVHDPVVKDRRELAANVKALQTLDARLDGLCEDWRMMEGAETTKEVIVSAASDLGIGQDEVDASALPASVEEPIEEDGDDLLKLIKLRQSVVSDQAGMRAAIRDAASSSKEDDKKSLHRRHDYRSFVRGWLGALAENEVLGNLIDD